jgi:catechol 2,3-dioxygenase-like lactoylglutathione lyase family enzyme
MKFSMIIETCIYSSNLKEMKLFYKDKIGLESLSEDANRHVFFKVGKSMLLIFNPEVTLNERDTIHGAITPPSIVHFAFGIKEDEFKTIKQAILDEKINIEKETVWENGGVSIYFRDPGGNLVEIITEGTWPL